MPSCKIGELGSAIFESFYALLLAPQILNFCLVKTADGLIDEHIRL